MSDDNSLKREADFNSRLLDFLAASYGNLSPTCFAPNLANDLANLTGASRVVVIAHPRHPRVVAASGAHKIANNSSLARLYRKVAKDFSASRESSSKFVAGGSDYRQWPRSVTNLLVESRAHSVVIVPVRTRDRLGEKPGTLPGALLLFEFFSEKQVTSPFDHALDALQPHLSNSIAVVLDHADSFWLMPLYRSYRWLRRCYRERKVVFATLILLAASIVVCCAMIPFPLNVGAEGNLLPKTRANVFALQDGKVEEIRVRDGQLVQSGDVLLVLRNEELQLKFNAVKTELETKIELLKLLHSQLGEAERNGQVSESLKFQEEILVAETEKGALGQQRELLEKQLDELQIRSPITGIVADFATHARLFLRPVERGQRLLQVCDTSGEWELRLRIKENRIGFIKAALGQHKTLPTRFLVTTNLDATFAASLTETAERTQLFPNIGAALEARADVASELPADKKVNSEVFARISCGDYPLYRVMFADVLDFIHRYSFY